MIDRPERRTPVERITDRINPVSPASVPEPVVNSRLAEVTHGLAELRRKWVEVGPSKRSGVTGDKLMRDYRKQSLEFWHLTGKHPPPIYADL